MYVCMYRQTVQMYSLVQLTSTGLSTSLISATARLHTCLRGAFDQDLNLKNYVSDCWPTQRNKELFDDHDHCEERKRKLKLEV